MKITFTIIMLFILAGCVSYAPSVPKGYTGDLATIDDSFQRNGRSKAHMFYIKAIDGKSVHNGLIATSNASYGKGAQLIAMGHSRSVRAEPLNLYIVGQVHHSAPVGYMLGAGSNYIVEGIVDFTPKKDSKYLVSGKLGETYSAVWVEDINGNVVSKTLELKSSSYVSTNQPGKKQKVEALSREELFLNITSGESESLVTEKLGKPDFVSKYDGNFFIEKPPSITYQYENLGSILFTSRYSKAQFVERIMPINNMSHDISSIRMQLDSKGETLQSLAKGYYRHDELKTEVLDLFAEKIWAERFTENRYEVDALSWLCKALAKSNNPRYRTLLEKIMNEANSSKARKYAKSSLELLPTEEVEQFVPARK